MELTGRSIIGFKRGQTDSADLHGFNPATGETLSPHITSQRKQK